MNPKAAIALLSLLSVIAIGTAVWNRTPQDLQHATAEAPPCDGGLCVFAPTRCQFITARGPGLGVELTDASSGLLLLKQCFTRCEFDGGIYDQIGEKGIPCKKPLYDGGLERCVDGSLPVTEDICKNPKTMPDLPPGVETLEATWSRDFKPGEDPTEVWTAEHPGAPWRCDCEVPGSEETALQMVTVPLPCAPVEVHGPVELDPDGGLSDTGTVPSLYCPGGSTQVEQTVVTKPARRIKMPCSTWMGVDPVPAACRRDECKGRACGTGRLGGNCGPQSITTDAGVYKTCVGNQYVRECDPTWECGAGKWYAEKCERECPEPIQDPDAGLCYGKPKCADHTCVPVPKKCPKVTAVEKPAVLTEKPVAVDARVK